jgi:hypothetical protein
MADIIAYANPGVPDDTGDGLTPQTAKKYAYSALNLCKAAAVVSGHKLYLANGTYLNDYISISNNNLGLLQIIGESRDGVIINPVTAIHAITSDGVPNGISISNLTAVAPLGSLGLYLMNDSDNYSINNVRVKSGPNHTGTLVNFTGAANINVNGLLLEHNVPDAVDKTVLKIAGDTSGILNNVCMSFPGQITRNGLWFDSTGAVHMTNSLLGGGYNPILKQGSGALTGSNNVVFGPCTVYTTPTVTITAGTLATNHSIVLGPIHNLSNLYSGTPTEDTETIALRHMNPKYLPEGRRVYVIPCIDDQYSVNYAQALEALLAARGHKGTYFVETAAWNHANTHLYRNIISRGTLEIGIHSHSHSDMTFSGSIWATSASITIDRAANTITTPGGTVAGFKTKSLAEIRTELQSAPHNLTVSILSGKYETNIAGAMDSHALGEVLGSSVGTSVSILVDPTLAGGIFKSEVVDAKALLESIIKADGGYDDFYATSWAYPFTRNNDNSRAALYAAGLEVARGAKYQTLANYDILQGATFTAGIIGADVAATKKNVAEMLANALYYGIPIFILGHSDSEISTIEPNGWEAILDAIEEFGDFVDVISAKELGNIVKAPPWTHNAGMCTRTYPSVSNYRFQSTSPCIGAGVSIPSIHEQATPATDLDGNTIHFLPPSIGPYDGQGDTKTITTNLIATGYSVRGMIGSPAKIKLAEHDLSVDLSGLTNDEYIQVKAGSKRVAGFIGRGINTYVKGSGGSSDGIFGSNFS